MTPSGAYEDEMGRFLRLSDEELSRLLAGETGTRDEALDEVASLLGEVRGAFAVSVTDEKVRELHLSAISEAAQLTAEKGNPVARPASKAHGPVRTQVSGLPKWRSVMDRAKGIALKVFAGTIAASTSMVGLAHAGVDLPGQAAERAYEAILGLELPNQDSGEETAVEEDATTTEVETEPKGSKATGDEKSAAGRAKAAEKSGGRSEARGAGASDKGRATASDKSDGASDAGAANSDTDSQAENAGTSDDEGRATADDASSSGRDTGSSRADAGSANAGAPEDLEDPTEADDAAAPALEDASSAAEAGQANNPTDNGRP